MMPYVIRDFSIFSNLSVKNILFLRRISKSYFVNFSGFFSFFDFFFLGSDDPPQVLQPSFLSSFVLLLANSASDSDEDAKSSSSDGLVFPPLSLY